MVGRIVVINDFSVARGGATALALLSLRLFRELGISITYVTGDEGNNPLFNEIGVDHIACGGDTIDAGSRLLGAFKGIYNNSARDLLVQWINDNDRPDTVYHIHGWSKILSPQIFVALRPVASRTFVHAHDFFFVCPTGSQYHYGKGEPCTLKPLGAECLASNCDKRSYADKLWRSAREAVLRSILSKYSFGAPKVLLIHEKMAPFFTRAGINQTQLQTIRNPVTPFTQNRVTVEKNTFAYFIGRLEPEKGIQDAAQAAKIAEVPLKVIGDGTLRAKLTQSFPDVEFLGWRSQSEISSIIQDARMVVMPTRYPEPFGLVALEAASCGIPVIMSNTAFLAEEFTKLEIGFTCDPSNHDQFAKLLRRVADMPNSELMGMSQRMVQLLSESNTTPQKWRDALLACYNRVCT